MNTSTQSEPTSKFSKWGCRILSAWLVFHLAAIIISPLSVSPASPLARKGWEVTGPYSQALSMNHGYHYFAPNPGGSTLVGYEVTRSDGSVVSGKYPDKAIQPRLLYHRHFMLTEQLGQYERLPEDLRTQMVKAYAEQICREHHGESVTLTRVYHDVPSMERVLAGGKLDDPDLYIEEPLGTFTWADF